MTKRLLRIYWDSCVWLAYFNRESIRSKIPGNDKTRYGMCQAVLDAAERGEVEICTSAFTLAEVHTIATSYIDQDIHFDDFLKKAT